MPQEEGPGYEQVETAEPQEGPSHHTLARQNQGLTNSWVVDPQVWWRHPGIRIFVPIFIMGLDFFVYGEDPVNDSRVEYNFPILGHWYGLLCLWPSEASLVCYRIAIIIVCTLFGIFWGRQFVHHRFLRNWWGLTMFEGNNGTLICEVFCIFINLYIGALVYNFSLGGSMNYPISSNTYMEFYKWGKVFQIFSVLLDIMSIVMITDAVLQDRNHYPNFAAGLKRVWIDGGRGYFRVLATWLAIFGMIAATTSAILMTGHSNGAIKWKDRNFGGLSEVWRTNLLSLCVFCDLLAVAQDWEFPSFRTPMDVKIAGTFEQELSCGCFSKLCGCLCGRLPKCCGISKEDVVEFFNFKMSGPWLTYLPLVLAVIFGDLVCAKNQFTYAPANYGQYVDPRTHRIWNIMDKEYLQKAYTDGVLTAPELVTYEARRSAHTGKPLDASAASDIELNSRYVHSPIFMNLGSITDSELLAFLVGFVLAVGFMLLVAGGERAWRSKAVGLLGKVAS